MRVARFVIRELGECGVGDVGAWEQSVMQCVDFRVIVEHLKGLLFTSFPKVFARGWRLISFDDKRPMVTCISLTFTGRHLLDRAHLSLPFCRQTDVNNRFGSRFASPQA